MKVLAIVLGILLIANVAYGSPESEAARTCAMSIVPAASMSLDFNSIAMEVAVNCEEELVLMAWAAGLTMPDDDREYSIAVYQMALGMTGELLRQGMKFYFDKAMKCNV